MCFYPCSISLASGLAMDRLSAYSQVMDNENIIANRKAAAKRALEEARARKLNSNAPELPEEIGGRNGPEPTRFGDWEKKGIVSDF